MNQTAPALYPISTVSQITGVNVVTLRAWERRYKLIEPSRSEKGRRLYSDTDVQRIQTVQDMLAEGMTVSSAAEALRRAETADDTVQTPQGPWPEYIDNMVSAIADFDDSRLDEQYTQVMSLYSVDTVTYRLLIPLLRVLGDRWESGEGSVAEEHFFSVFMRNKLGARFHHRNLQNRGPRLLAACLPGENHEFGLLLFSLLAHSRGYRITLLGANLPLEEIPSVAERIDAAGVVLSGSITMDRLRLGESIGKLVADTDIPIFVGGASSEYCRDEINSAGAVFTGRDLTTGMEIIHQKLS